MEDHIYLCYFDFIVLSWWWQTWPTWCKYTPIIYPNEKLKTICYVTQFSFMCLTLFLPTGFMDRLPRKLWYFPMRMNPWRYISTLKSYCRSPLSSTLTLPVMPVQGHKWVCDDIALMIENSIIEPLKLNEVRTFKSTFVQDTESLRIRHCQKYTTDTLFVLRNCFWRSKAHCRGLSTSDA